VNKAFQHQAIKVTKEVIHAIQPRGPGGFDFLSGERHGAHSMLLVCEAWAFAEPCGPGKCKRV
jgi:hypothetical protein